MNNDDHKNAKLMGFWPAVWTQDLQNLLTCVSLLVVWPTNAELYGNNQLLDAGNYLLSGDFIKKSGWFLQ